VTHDSPSFSRILAIDPNSRGFGFALLEGEWKLVDWGLCEPRDGKRSQVLERLRDLIEIYRPDAVVVEDVLHQRCRRSGAANSFLGKVAQLTQQLNVRTCRVSVVAVRRAFGNEKAMKQAIASQIAERFPELKRRLPPKRKAWQSESSRMSIFDAIAFGIAYFNRVTKRRESHNSIS
jgi:Holliday junction resolvasome RuvABC endonuclease subunit